jgi:hypothetical protein
MEEARWLAAAGYTEIQLLGQNVNSYRDPTEAGWNFARLLEAVGQVEGIRRVRFTTSHPRDFTREIVEAIDRTPTLCNMIHLPVQSGSTRVLAAMQRQYTRERYLQCIAWMKSARRDIAISTDIIVGFPGETEEDFQLTLSLLDEVEYDSIFSFKYSVRPKTPAQQLVDHIPEEEKSRRLTLLQEHQRAIQLRRNTALIGSVQEVLVEGFHTTTGQWIGRTAQNRILNFTLPSAMLASREPVNRTLSPNMLASRDHGAETEAEVSARMPALPVFKILSDDAAARESLAAPTDAARAAMLGRYLDVRVLRAGPNSLVGQACASLEEARGSLGEIHAPLGEACASDGAMCTSIGERDAATQNGASRGLVG